MAKRTRSKVAKEPSSSVEESVEQMAEASEEIMLDSVGEQLQSARIEQDLSIDWIADQMRFPVEYVENIESGEYLKFRDLAIVRGYIRNYAGLVHLDADLLVEQFQNEVSISGDVKETPQIADRKRVNVAAFIHRHAGVLTLTGTVLLAVVVVATIWIAQFTELIDIGESDVIETGVETTTSDPVQSGEALGTEIPVDRAPTAIQLQTEPIVDTLTGSEIDTEPIYDEDTGDVIYSDLVDIGAPASEAGTGSEGETQIASPIGEPLQSDVGSAAPATTPAALPPRETEVVDRKLEFQFTEASWVRVIDDTGETLFMGIKAAGEDLVLDGSPPYQVQIGYRRGVTMKYGGEDQTIPQGTGDTADFIVGE